MSKNFEELGDLVYYGGIRPCYDFELHVGRPNVGPKSEFMKHVDDIFHSKMLTNNGPKVNQLSAAIKEMLGVKHCILVNNATIGLELVIRAVGLSGEVIVPSYTFIATAHALSWLGLTPVFADIDEASHTIDPDSIENLINERTSGILGTHLWGTPCDIDRLQTIADRYRLKLIFDAAHAFGNSYNETMIGNFGSAEVFSFHATKFFNCFEGGAITTNSDELADSLTLMRNFGFRGLDDVGSLGTNAKMAEVCAAMGLTNLDQISAVVQKNASNLAAYKKELDVIPGVTVYDAGRGNNSNNQYVVIELDKPYVRLRDLLVDILRSENILVRKYFWPSCHKMKPYNDLPLYQNLQLANTEKVAERVIVLPTGQDLPNDVAANVAAIIKLVFSKHNPL